MADVLVRNGLVFTYIHEGYHALKLRNADVLIEGGVITKIEPGLSAPCETLDAGGCLVLPGFVNMGSRAVESRLLAGLLADKNLERFGGTYLHERILPVTELAIGLLTAEEAEAIAILSLWEGLRGGTTTAVDLCAPAFAAAVQSAGEKLGMRLFAVPMTARKELGGAFYGEADGLRFAHAAYSEATREQIRTLRDAELDLLRGCVVGQCVEARPLDRELLHANNATAAVSAIGCVQEGRAYPAVSFLRSGVNTALATGFYGNGMLAEMRTAAFSAKQGEKNPGQYKATDAFYAATSAGARALGQEDSLGRIDIGMRGDLSVVSMESLEPLSYPFIQYLYNASPSDTRHVVSRGKAVLKGGEPEPALGGILSRAKELARVAVLKVWEEARRTVL